MWNRFIFLLRCSIRSAVWAIAALSIRQSLATEAFPLPSAMDSSKITLIHVIRPEKVPLWKERFFPQYQNTQSPPQEWFQFGKWSGLMVQVVPRQDIKTLTYEQAFALSRYGGIPNASEWKDEGAIIFVANPKDNAVWLSSINEKEHSKIFRHWRIRNLFRTNKFSKEFQSTMEKDHRSPFRHSGIYEDYNIIGHGYKTLGPEGLPFSTGVITNGNTLAESQLYIPDSESPTGKTMIIHHDTRVTPLARCVGKALNP